MKIERNIVAPFVVFFIIIEILGFIVLPMAKALWEFSEETNHFLFDLSWATGGVIALLYSLVVLRQFLRESWPEKILYCVLAIVLIGVSAFPFLKQM